MGGCAALDRRRAWFGRPLVTRCITRLRSSSPGLAVAVAFHAGLFNIGGEGQAYVGGLGSGGTGVDDVLPGILLAAIAFGALFGALWGFIPGYLQARRGSHIDITTIMFNFLASALMVYMMVNVLRMPGR